ncbi:anti-sigma factor family protein [Streptomyces sp. NPDC055060]
MTTTTDSAGHPEVAEISDLTEGLLTPSRTSDVRRHLDGCELCADVYNSLEEIRGLLGTLPGPPRMPADVAGRIDAALAAEALLDSLAPESPEPSESSESPAAARSTESAPLLEPAAAVRVSRETSRVSGEPAEASESSGSSPSSASSPPSDRPAGHARASTGPGRRSRLRGGRRRNVVLGAVFTAAALGLGSLLIQNMGGDSGGPGEKASGHNDSAHAFSEGNLKGQVTDLLAKAPSTGPSQGSDSGSTEPSFGVRSSPESPKEQKLRESTVTVPQCIQLSLGDRTPLAAEEGTYKGKDAYLVVASHDSDTTKVSAYVIDATCVDKASSETAAGKVLLTNSYARP